MLKLNTSRNSGVNRLIEKRMRNWEIARSQRTEEKVVETPRVLDFVSISRRLGSGGDEVAQLLGQRLQWSVLDKDLLRAMAGDDDVREALYKSMDQRDLDWFEEMLHTLDASKHPRNDYFRQLTEAILSIARQGPVVFLGRGADLILPPDVGLRVRFEASESTCTQNFARQENLALFEAKARLKDIQNARRRFIENHFHVEARREHRFDLVMNLDRWSPEQAVELILAAMRLRNIDIAQ